MTFASISPLNDNESATHNSNSRTWPGNKYGMGDGPGVDSGKCGPSQRGAPSGYVQASDASLQILNV